MALGEISMFSWKNKETQRREQEQYAAWAFPYGQKQRDYVEKLLGELLPKENTSISLISFLTCKELYENALKDIDPDSSDNADNPDISDTSGNLGASDGSDGYNMVIGRVMSDQKRYKRIIKSKDMPTYIALVMADAKVDELCAYPTADEIRAHADKLSAWNAR